jgi:predicted kinase
MEAILLVGLPGSGKSTWAAKQGKLIINRDAIRNMVYGKYDFRKDDEPVILDMAQACVLAAANARRDIIIDETGVNIGTRAKYIEMLKRAGYNVHCRWFSASVETCIARRKKDTKGYDQDWEEVIRSMAKVIKPPSLSEGYSFILVMGEDGDVILNTHP